jgi:hypothetical protein
MTYQEIENAVLNIKGIGGMTVNERLYISGLIDEFDSALENDKNKAKFILELLKVDDLSIEKILNNDNFNDK